MALKPVSLNDKYTVKNGRVFLSGNQALVRLPMIQRELDRQAGLNTAGFISGYRGSPLGAYDAALWQAKAKLAEHNIVFQPGVNEDLAATAVWGTQQLDSLPKASVEGVFSIWYGKGPGVDRSGDPFKHGNMTGTHRNGGVLVLYGDDHPGKSSTVSHQSEQALAANSIPSLYPSGVQEIIDFGLLGWAMSRYTGLWVGLKTVNETVEQTTTIDLDLDGIQISLPKEGIFPDEGVHFHPAQFNPQLDEMLVTRYKLPLVHEFVRANRIDKVVVDTVKRCLGIITAGKTYQDVQQALMLLGIDEKRANILGLSVYKVGCIWPLEPQGIKAFARGQEELFVVEEKKAFLEDQAAKVLYNESLRPRIVGKFDEQGQGLLPADVQLEPAQIALAIAARLESLGVGDVQLETRVSLIRGRCTTAAAHQPAALERMPYFCSGCPHNSSTKVPDGSYAGAGIGCHGMSVYIRPNTLTFAQMGGEGATWYGLSQFTETNHIFQNLGDGTYYHSGFMAIRGAVAAGVNITYKILYNDAVAMTGGQPIDGPISVGAMTQQVIHEGVKQCVVVTDSPDAYGAESGLAAGVKVYHRDELERIQRQLRDTDGCTVLIYEQTCAAEKRRRRKRGKLPDPQKRVFINDAVCEGCGDCSVQANCVSIQPKETELGRKRQIDQSSCNKDYSCVKGFCPSFVTVMGGQLKNLEKAALNQSLFDGIPKTGPAEIGDGNYGIMVSGIGGTGVITVTAVLGMAAHLENKVCSIYDMTGLSQKNGAVFSHLRIANQSDDLRAPKLSLGDANLALGFDMVAALSKDALQTLDPEQTCFIGNSRVAPTAAFQTQPDLQLEAHTLEQQVTDIVGEARSHFIDATGLGFALMGDTIASNMFVVGYAAQLGLLPISIESIEKAIELNGVAVPFNIKAFQLGRLWAWKPELLRQQLTDGLQANGFKREENLDVIEGNRVELLTEYQDQKYAKRYQALLAKVRKAEAAFGGAQSDESLSIAVARYFAKLMLYKDEYEVARLYSRPEFMDSVKAQFEGEFRLKFNLAPPLLSRRDPITGQLQKREFGSWIMAGFKVIAKFKGLRGTRLDIFGYTQERRDERQLIEDYQQVIERLLPDLSTENYCYAVKLAELPEQIRGFGHVKERNMVAAKKQQEKLLEQYSNPPKLTEYVEVKMVG